jgi:hypothetical protein
MKHMMMNSAVLAHEGQEPRAGNRLLDAGGYQPITVRLTQKRW